MLVQVIAVNHGTTRYAELMLRSLLQHHRHRSHLQVLLLDNDSPDIERLDLLRDERVRIEQSGYGLDHQVTTHGEILAAAVLANPDCDAYLFVDSDVCFRSDRSIDRMADELAADAGLFGVQARWLLPDGTEFAPEPGPPDVVGIRESVRAPGATAWSDAISYDVVRHGADRIHPFCALIGNTTLFRRTVETFGLSPAMVQSERSGRWWDTLGLMTQVMRINGLTWRRSEVGVTHFGNVSWDDRWAAEKAADRDRLMTQYVAD